MPEFSRLLVDAKSYRRPDRPARFVSQGYKTAGGNSFVPIQNPELESPYVSGEDLVRNPRLPAQRLKRVFEYVDAHLDENITLAELAQDLNLSVYYFATLFKKTTGLSPHQYILHRRVSRARQLLRNTDLSVLDVSLDLGFQHQNNFARAFRRVTGMTPTGFRQRNRSK